MYAEHYLCNGEGSADEAEDARTPLDIFQALLMGRKKRVDQLLDNSTNEIILHLKARDELGRTPLFLACQYGSVKLVEKIIATGAAKIDQTDQDNWSPLFIACLRGHTKVVEKLLEVGADPEIRENRFGWTPFLAACFAGHEDIARMLIAHAAKIGVVDNEKRSALFLAVLQNHVVIIDLLLALKDKLDVNASDVNDRTPFYLAVQNNNIPVVDKLLLAGCDINHPDKDGRSPIVFAYKSGDKNIVDYLIAKGANTVALENIAAQEAMRTINDSPPCEGIYQTTMTPEPQTKVMVMTREGDNRLWCGCSDGSILVFDLNTNAMVVYADKIQKRTIHDLILVGDHVWSLSGNREVYIWKWNPDATQKNVHDPSPLTLVDKIQQQEINCIIRVGEEIYGGSCNNTVFVWNSKAIINKEVKVFIPSHIQLPDFEKFVSAILYHKDRIYVAIKKVVLCYDMKTFDYKGCLEGHNNVISKMVAFDDFVLSCSRDGSIRVWNVQTLKCEKVKEKVHGGEVFCLLFTGGDQLLSAGFDKNILCWNYKTLDLQKQITTSHSREIASLFWDSQRHRLWVGSLDKTVSLWQ
eukprot:TRINITY_DN3403_c0_g1_i1.p1 TRINITY_DN3403_c0_g1~~TRINITY_DN3403_c0_g1_i1.p1  ORF type:complete len:581 (+),score=35.74 TRINITY_DN3403_c0_g1_i1:377-2119(+)